MRQQEKVIIWPAYFDSTRTRKQGRRVPKNLASSSPQIQEIKTVAEKLQLNCEFVADVAYPNTPWLKSGMILVKKKNTKSELIKSIAKQLLKTRNVTSITK
jgi:signal recognition particle subunit SRP19